MSIQAMAWALDQDIPNSGLKLVLIVLCNHVDKDSWMWRLPRKQIEHEASMSRSSVKRHIKRLAELGIIEFSTNHEASGRQQWNTYRVVTDPAEQKEIAARQADFMFEAVSDREGVNLDPSRSVDNAVENPVENRGEGSADGPPEGSASDPLGGAASGPPIERPSRKPSEKPSSAPPQDARGNFIITPDRPEWDVWLDAVKPTVRDAYQRSGRIVSPRQWPTVRPSTNAATEERNGR